MLFWPGPKRGAKWGFMYTLATQIDLRAKKAEKIDKQGGHRGRYLLKFLNSDDEGEGAICKWNSEWYIEQTGDIAVGKELLGWEMPGDGTAPSWAISGAQRTAMYEFKARSRTNSQRWSGWSPEGGGGGWVPKGKGKGKGKGKKGQADQQGTGGDGGQVPR